MSVSLILGGARSGKSAYAEAQALNCAGKLTLAPVLIATAEALDEEMAARISLHRAARNPNWQTIESPVALAATIAGQSSGKIIVVDCLTLWLSNLLMRNAAVESEVQNLLTALAAVRTPIFLVSNEVGLGIVPDNALARQFRDHAGRLNQAIAKMAARVVFMVAGLPLVVK